MYLHLPDSSSPRTCTETGVSCLYLLTPRIVSSLRLAETNCMDVWHRAAASLSAVVPSVLGIHMLGVHKLDLEGILPCGSTGLFRTVRRSRLLK